MRVGVSGLRADFRALVASGVVALAALSWAAPAAAQTSPPPAASSPPAPGSSNPEVETLRARVAAFWAGRVTGDLTLHGVTRPLTFAVARREGHFRGTASIRQRDFGIQPISVAGGTVKVKDELRVEFDVVERREQAP